MPHSAAAAGTVPSFFNAIFHGPFIFAFYENRVEVLAADIKEHIVGAGTFQSERPCVPGTYSVLGITTKQGAMQAVDPQTHVILDADKTEFKIARESYYRFVLPLLPSRITPLGLLTPKQKLVFVGDDAGDVVNPPKFGSAHALTYSIGADERLQLENVQWTPVVQTVDKVNAISLHIFAESPYQLDLLHPNRDFTSLVSYLPGLSLDVQRPFPDIAFETNPKAFDFGIDGDEQGGLRGLPTDQHLVPPRICDSPSMVVTNAADAP